MAISMASFKGGKIALKAARVLVGMPGHRPSLFNVKVGQCMKAAGARPSPGGRYSEGFQRQFVQCCISAGANVGATARRKFGV